MSKPTAMRNEISWDTLPPSLVERLRTRSEDRERAAAAILAAFPEEARETDAALARLRERSRRKSESLRALFAEWNSEDVIEDPDEATRRDDEYRAFLQALDENRVKNGERPLVVDQTEP